MTIKKPNISKISKPSPVQFVIVGLVLWLLLGGAFLLINRGFYYADYQTTYKLDLPENATAESKFTELSKDQYVAQLDRDQHIVYYQMIPAETLNKIMADLKANKDTAAVTLTQSTVVRTEVLFAKVVLLVVLSLIVFTGFVFYTIINKMKRGRLNVWKLLGFLLVSVLLGVAAQLGALSLISRIYNLTEISITTLSLGMVWGMLLIYLVIYDYAVRHNAETDLGEAINMNFRHTGGMNKRTVVFLGIILVLITFGLGSKFLIEAILIFLAIMSAGIFLQYSPIVLYHLNRNSFLAVWKSFRISNSPELVEMTAMPEDKQLPLKATKLKKTAPKHKQRRK